MSSGQGKKEEMVHLTTKVIIKCEFTTAGDKITWLFLEKLSELIAMIAYLPGI